MPTTAGERLSKRLLDVVAASTYRKADVTDADDLRALLAACDHDPAVYFALPPAVTEKSCAVLKDLDLPSGTRLALEKPFGTDAASAEHLNDLLHSFLPEERIHRVDHFLGRSTVLNLLGLRFANRIVESRCCRPSTSPASTSSTTRPSGSRVARATTTRRAPWST